MVMEDGKSFCSKILLFGEYSIIQNSMALSVPYPLFSGKLVFKSKEMENEGSGHSELVAFSQYLKDLLRQKEVMEMGLSFDLNSFLFDIGQGLIFSSTIPQGFGVGSSGALVAALFHRYGKLERPPGEILSLRKIFAKMESHFHGKSSGIDPLISYLNHPLLISSQENLGLVRLPTFKKDIGKDEDGRAVIFLLNTNRTRRTEPLVHLYLEKCKEKGFCRLIQDEFIPITNECITEFLEGRSEQLYHSFRALSHFQYENLSPMIPNLYRDVWKSGLERGDYFLKLCGAGGGGFLLGMTTDFRKACEILGPHQLRLVLTLGESCQ